MFRLAGFPKNFLHLVQSCSDIPLYQSLCYNIRLTVFENIGYIFLSKQQKLSLVIIKPLPVSKLVKQAGQVENLM